jgi:hypothetical protein
LDVTPSMAAYAKGLAHAAQERAYELAIEADEAIERAQAGGWMDDPTGDALAKTEAADTALGHAIDAGRWAWEADRLLAAEAGAGRQTEIIYLPEPPQAEAG